MTDAVIVDAIRTPIGALGGSLATVRPDDLAGLVIRCIVERNRLDPAQIEEVYLGCANQAGEDNRNVARMAALLAGLPRGRGGVTVNRLCASGLNAVEPGRSRHPCGRGRCLHCRRRGVHEPRALLPAQGRGGFTFGNLTAWDTALGWRYPNPRMKSAYGTESMGETAENIARERPHITREQQDAFAVRSHQRAIAAIDSGRFSEETYGCARAAAQGGTRCK